MYKFIFLFDLFQYLLLLRFEPSPLQNRLSRKTKTRLLDVDVMCNVFLVYCLEEDGNPPWEGDDMSAKFIGELVLQEILCSWHQVLQALHTLQGVFNVFVKTTQQR